MNKLTNLTIAMLFAASGVCATGDANAVTAFRGLATNGGGNCQGALPVYDTSLRQRPLLISNEGNSTVYVTCNYQTEVVSDDGVIQAEALVYNHTGVTKSTTCTLVVGFEFGPVTYIPITNDIPGDSGFDYSWSASANGGSNFYEPVSMSCALPAGTGIGEQFIYWEVDIGT